ncbi:MAG: hypothetical protein KDB86_11520 [Actinobacteria bacterium]|nr:hypothetical protein [Actinomycetota bacterium]MCB9389016.1 hypothetical protein [Acidimicrobiia bacterium]
MPRVLSSDAARTAVTGAIAKAGNIHETLNQLKLDGDALNTPENWDGALAAQFRGEWPQHQRNFELALQSIDAVADWAKRVNENIMVAGGNGA